MAEWWEWTGEPGPWESHAAPQMDWGGVGADYSSGYDAPIGPGLGWDAGGYPTGAAGSGLSLEQQVAQAIAQRPDLYGTSVSEGAGGGSSFWGSLGKLLLGGGQAAAGALGGGGAGSGGILGPLLSTLGSLGGGAIGSNAANEAAQLQSQALNRGIDLSTSQWLQQLERTQPWVGAGQQALGTLQGLAGQQLPGLPGAMPSVDPRAYGLPDPTPLWQPMGYQGPAAVNAGDYRWNPQQGPRAQDFRYTPGQTPDAAQYQYRPGAVPTLSGQELLANDPGVAFRLAEGRKALEGSAAARGGLLSGPTLAALQRQGQELSSQEYSNAFARAAQQAQMREQWQQQAMGQNFGQAMSAAQLREQINQIASQQGWSQSQAEAAFREAMASQSSQQGFAQALGAQGQQWQQGFANQQWEQQQRQLASDQLYNRNMERYKTILGGDVARNQTDYERQQALYKQQLGQSLLPWEQNSVLASLGGQMAGQLGNQGIASSSGISSLLGQLGTTQGMGALGSAGQWNTALAGGIGGIQNILKGLNA